ncbi:tetratricopeptide repeat protein [Dysgonomonas termitidis]
MFSSCNLNEHKTDEILSRVEILIEQNPGEALQILNNEIDVKKLDKDAYNKYILLHIQAKDKAFEDITNDTLIFATKKYYEEKGDEENIAMASLYSGYVSAARGDMQKAMTTYLNAEVHAKEGNNSALKGLIEFYIGDLYWEQLLNDEAIFRYRQAISHFNKAGKYKNEIIAYDKIGSNLLMKGEIDSSFHYYNKGLSLAKIHSDSIEQAFIIRNMGFALGSIGEQNQARTYFRHSIPYLNNNEEIAKNYLNMAYSFDDEQNKDSTLFYINKSLKLLEGRDNYSLKLIIYQLLAKTEEKENNYQQALTNYKEYAGLLKKMLKNTNNRIILDVQKKYDFELLQNENNRLLIQRQTAFLVILLLFIIILAMSLIFYRKRAKDKAALAVAQERILQMQEMADNIDEKESSFRKVLFQHFDIFKKVALLKVELKGEEKKHGQKLLKKVNEIVYNQEGLDWSRLFDIMNQLYKGVPNTIRKKYPQLDEIETRICCLEYAGLSNNEIAIILEFSVNTIQMKKSVIRKKLEIEGYGNIVEFFHKNLN